MMVLPMKIRIIIVVIRFSANNEKKVIKPVFPGILSILQQSNSYRSLEKYGLTCVILLLLQSRKS